ncbi:MAG: glycosyltransferase family 2 protein [Pseudomonadota bacterium]
MSTLWTDVLVVVLALSAVYSYFLYPLILMLLPKREPGTRANDELPSVTLIIAAHNEATRIEEKLTNSLAIDYPADRFEILVASDCSTDETDDIVERTEGVTLVRADQHLGKEYAQSLAVKAATGDILVFSDAATSVPLEAIRNLVDVFRDPMVGAVSSEDRFITDDGEVAGEGLYVRYEMWLRAQESRLAGLVGLSGSFFAARASVCRDWDIVSPSDFNTALNCARQGLVAVSSPAVVGIYKDIKNPAKEFQRKVRTVIRGMTAVARAPVVLSFSKMGWFAFQVWSHKIMRWLVPWFLLVLAVATLLVPKSPLVLLALIAQLLFYGAALMAWVAPVLRESGLMRVVFFFAQVNAAIGLAAIQFVRGKRITTWKPSVR